MKKIILFILFTQNWIIALSQDDFNYLFPFQHGISRFEVRTILNQNKNVSVANDWSNICLWDKIEYLNYDSVYQCEQHFEFLLNKLFTCNGNKGHLIFADDKLFSIIYELKYRPNEFQTLLTDYNNLHKIIASKFPNFSKRTISIENKDGGTEQVGEGYKYSIDSLKESDLLKHGVIIHKDRYIEINYLYEYKLVWDEYFPTPKAHRSSEIEHYIIKIEYVDLRNVKYDSRGFPSY